MTQENVVAIVEARMTSSRLPGKHMLPANGKPILSHLINRLKAVPSVSQVVIATTQNSNDDILEELSAKEDIGVFRGSEEDVMGRVLQAALTFEADAICEVTGDCPIIDVELLDQLVKTYLCNDAVYVNNGSKSFLPDGMSAQVFSTEILKKSENMTDAPLDREHVTLHIKRNPKMFPAIYLVAPTSLSWPGLGLTLDEQRDYELLRRIVEYFGEDNHLFNCLDVINLLRQRPEWVALNEAVHRKGDT